MPMSKLFDAFRKTALIPLVSTNLSQKWCQYVQFELVHHYITYHPDQKKGAQENEVNRFLFVLTL